MKLYTTITSERGTRAGKGGDKRLYFDFTAGNANNVIATMTLERFGNEWEIKLIITESGQEFIAKGKM